MITAETGTVLVQPSSRKQYYSIVAKMTELKMATEGGDSWRACNSKNALS